MEPDAAPFIVDAAPVDTMSMPSGTCWTLTSTVLIAPLSACPPTIVPALDLSQDLTIDTTNGTSTALGVTCALISNGPDDLCVLAASTITVRAGVTLTAHGARPLALLAHDIDLQGMIDVASHRGQPRGPGAVLDGCNPARAATQSGGGGGGGFDVGGADGGDQGGVEQSRGLGGNSIGVRSLRGGCDGTGGGSGMPTGEPRGVGGAGGGAVWLSADTGTLTIGSAAQINASGAGGSAGEPFNRGGSGGGSGGLIVLQARTLVRVGTTSQILAAGGGGGGGARDDVAGQPGDDPVNPSQNGGRGGAGGGGTGSHSGDGGEGGPSAQDGEEGDTGGSTGGGGGGGGGAPGLIWYAADKSPGTTNIVPDPINIGR